MGLIGLYQITWARLYSFWTRSTFNMQMKTPYASMARVPLFCRFIHHRNCLRSLQFYYYPALLLGFTFCRPIVVYGHSGGHNYRAIIVYSTTAMLLSINGESRDLGFTEKKKEKVVSSSRDFNAKNRGIRIKTQL